MWRRVMETRYDIHEPIGEGSFGRVYKGRDKFRKETVALKFVRKNGKHITDLAALKQECEIQKKLKHAHIIQLLDSIETHDYIILVTEYAKGDLFSLIKNSGPLPVAKVQYIASQLVSALYYLHSQLVLHRDLKPQNILIGMDGFVKLCDFGFARTLNIGQYLLTSVKGTPLYMAPEIMQHKPYDQNSEFWSLGCIVYELIVGEPPFNTHTLMDLMSKIAVQSVSWPDKIAADPKCYSFLKGLLEKDPTKRLKWPELKEHPFIEAFFLMQIQENENFSLTKALSPSQELAKEKQRQHLQKKLDGYSKLLVKTAKKLEEAQKELKRCSTEMPLKSPAVSPQGSSRSKKTEPPARDASDSDSASSYETMTSTSSSLSDASEDCQTVILDQPSPTPRLLFSPTSNHSGAHQKSHESACCSSKKKVPSPVDTVQSGMENLNLTSAEKSKTKRPSEFTCKSDAFFTLHSFGSEDKPIESEEWIYFVGNTMKEVQENPASLCDKPFLTVLVAPLRNHLAEAVVIGKIATLLAMPFTLVCGDHDLQKNLETVYMDAKVLPNLLYACKLVVRRRKIAHDSSLTTKEEHGSNDDLINILEEEDFEALDKCTRLINYLVHLQKEFAVQLCDSIFVLQGFPILSLFLRSHTKKARLTLDTLAVLCHILRILPANTSIVEELLLPCGGSEEEESQIFALLNHSDPGIQCKALRLLGHLITLSEATRKQLCHPNSDLLWDIITQASAHPNDSISAAAEFTSLKLQQLIPVPQRTNCEADDDPVVVSQ